MSGLLLLLFLVVAVVSMCAPMLMASSVADSGWHAQAHYDMQSNYIRASVYAVETSLVWKPKDEKLLAEREWLLSDLREFLDKPLRDDTRRSIERFLEESERRLEE